MGLSGLPSLGIQGPGNQSGHLRPSVREQPSEKPGTCYIKNREEEEEEKSNQGQKWVGKAQEELRNLIPLWTQMMKFCKEASRGSSGSVSERQRPG